MAILLGGIYNNLRPLRNGRHVTMLDPLQDKYGKVLGSFFYIPAFAGEVIRYSQSQHSILAT